MSQVAVQLREWERVTPDDWPALAARRLADRGVERLTADWLSTNGRLEILELARGLELRAASWVGRVVLGDLAITIRPKLAALPLLNLLRYAYRLRNLQLIGEARFETEQWSFQDLLVAQLAAEASELVARGLHRDYRRSHENLASPGGRIDFGRYLDSVASAAAALPCVHYPRTGDTPLNQALLQGIMRAAVMTQCLGLRTQLRRLAAQIDLEGSPGYRLDRFRLVEVLRGIDRRTSHYRPALNLIGLLLQGEGLTLERIGGGPRLPGFLFDMNAFFQALLSRFLRDYLADADVIDEHRLRGVFFYDPAHNPRNRRDPIPRPDFLVRKENHTLAVLDAKYRDVWERSLPREMLYQLAVYALTQPQAAATAIILYPTAAPAARDQVIVFQDVLRARSIARVVLRPVNLLAMEQLLHAAPGAEIRRKREEMAQRLIAPPSARTAQRMN